MSKTLLGWILALSLPGILVIRFLNTFIFTVLGYIGDTNLELSNIIKSFINYGLVIFGLLSIITTPIGIILLSKSNTFISEAITTGWKLTKKYFWILILLGGIVYLPSLLMLLFDMSLQYIPGATALVTDPLTNMTQAEPIGNREILSYIIAIISGIAGAWLGLGFIKTQLMILSDKKPSINDLSLPFIYLLRLIGGQILIGLAVVIGLIALIIPGIYIAIRLSMFKYFIVEGYAIIDAIKASRASTEGQVWNLLRIGFVYAGVAILGVLALGIGLLWAIPTILLAEAYVYLQLKKNLPHDIKPIH